MKKIILIAGPSGAGKTTISEYLTKNFAIPRVLTHTTRPKRAGEDENSYYFENDETFAQLHFFEHVHYGAYQYGSSQEALDKAWLEHDLVSLIVDIEGVKSYINRLKDQVYFLYVKTSTIEELRERLLERGDKPETINQRLSGKELNALPKELEPFAHILVNDDWQTTTNWLDQMVQTLTKK